MSALNHCIEAADVPEKRREEARAELTELRARRRYPPLISGPMPSHQIPIQPCEWEGRNPLTGETLPQET